MAKGWIITHDHLADGKTLHSSVNTKSSRGNGGDDPTQRTHIKLYDDDKILYYEGLIALDDLNGPEDLAFDPLRWAMNDAGCTRMDYLDPKDGLWKTL